MHCPYELEAGRGSIASILQSLPVLGNVPEFKFAVWQWGRVHEVFAGVSGFVCNGGLAG